MSHSQDLGCSIRLSKIVTLCNYNCTASTEEMLAQVDLATINHLPLSGVEASYDDYRLTLIIFLAKCGELISNG